ncbi:MAG: phosphodiester glycosidase family protein, partial [Cyanobacteria bacterium P01_A01_bin.80]
MPQEKDGCAIFMRRTFLFFVGLAAAKLLKEYFSVAQNRADFWSLLKKGKKILERKYISWRTGEPEVTSIPVENLPSQTVESKPIIPDNNISEEIKSQPVEEKDPFPAENAESAKSTAAPENKSSVVENSVIKGEPVKFEKKTLFGVSFYQTTINLKDPEAFITIGLANDAPQANTNKQTYGDESFANMVDRAQAAVVINGTFFSKDEEKRVMGNLVAGGQFLKYSQWENYATTLGIKVGNELEMVTARKDGQPNWSEHWFSLTCGPRLLKDGKIWLQPELEGFKDPHVFDTGGRTAIGYPQSGDQIYLVTFLSILSLEDEAKLMQGIGCYQAMNLDGGASRSLAYRNQIIVPAGRNLT